MNTKASPARDEFTLSLGGATAVNAFGLVPAVSARALVDARGGRRPRRPGGYSAAARAIEDFLARWFAPGCLHAAERHPTVTRT